MHYGLIVIGAGVAGCAAALEATRLGLDVLLVDTAPVPGLGTFSRGAVPAALLRQVAALQPPRAPTGHAPRARFDLPDLTERRRTLLANHLAPLFEELEASRVIFERGCATLRSSTEVRVEGEGVRTANAIVIATGSRPRGPASFPFDGRVVCDEESVFQQERLPRGMVIVGTEVVGCEFACLFAALGVNVTLIDRRRRLLCSVDHEFGELLHARMQKLGIVVALGEEIATRVFHRDGSEPSAALTLSSGRVEKCDRLLVLAGRKPETAELGLATVEVQVDDRGFISVDEHCQTSRPGIYAVGDVIGHPFRIGSALHQARCAVLHASGRPRPRLHAPPMAIYTQPEIASVGLIEEAARRLGVAYRVGFARLEDTFRGRVDGRVAGLLKLLFERDSQRLLGVQIIGESATDLVQLGAAWLVAETTLQQIADAVFNHPSLAEAYRLAALDALKRD